MAPMNAVVTDTRRTPGVTVQSVPIEAVRIGVWILARVAGPAV